jgi:hypothetical protein
MQRVVGRPRVVVMVCMVKSKISDECIRKHLDVLRKLNPRLPDILGGHKLEPKEKLWYDGGQGLVAVIVQPGEKL